MAGFLLRAAPVFEIREAGGNETNMLVSTPEPGAALAKTLGQARSDRRCRAPSYAEVERAHPDRGAQDGQRRLSQESEAAKIAETNDASIGRSWEIWKFKTLANTPKF